MPREEIAKADVAALTTEVREPVERIGEIEQRILSELEEAGAENVPTLLNALAEARAREATRQLRELEPDWRGPESLVDPEGIEGRIAHHEATAEAAEARLAEILRDAIPGTNPSWGVNRLTKELYDRGFFLERPTDSPSLLYKNPETGEEVRIMQRPLFQGPRDPPEKFTFEHYYRYRPGFGRPEGSHVPIPHKD